MISRPLCRHVIGAALWACGVLLVGLLQPAAAAKVENHLILQARVIPADPFSDLNRAGVQDAAKMEWPRGSTFLVEISGHTIDDWYTYPLTKRAPDQTGKLAKLTVEGDQFQLLYPAQESDVEWKPGDDVVSPELVHKKPFTWTQEVYVKPDAKPGPTKLVLKLAAQVCKKSCVDEFHTLEVPVTIAASEAPANDTLKGRLAEKPPAPTTIPVPADLKPKEGKADAPGGSRSSGSGAAPKVPSGLLGSIGTAIGGGIISLLTPCVFPMIPITVSYFLKQAERRKQPAPALATGTGTGITSSAAPVDDGPAPHSPLMMAAIYSGTIVLVLTAGGLALQEVLVQISTHPITNLVLGALFLFFALSLLGWYDITLPSWLQDVTSSREGRGGLAGVFFMALTFSIVSFACVGPIYGSFISLRATSAGALGWFEKALPVLAYSIAFASPFFVLALFPALLRTMPRAGSWMNAVKVVMGFLELAAVVKFLRTAELVWKGRADLMSYDLSMGLYVAISVACGLYLLGLYRLPHDHDPPESIGVPRLMFALAFVGLGLYLLPSLFKGDGGESQRPGGTVFAWIDSFLLPEPESPNKPAGKSSNGPSVTWEHNLKEALAKAQREKKLVFLDFTGTSCTNCKLNERNVFPRPEVQQAFGKHVLLKLFTDKAPPGFDQQPDEAASLAMRNKRFDSAALPLYALLRPVGDDFEIVAKFGEDGNGLIEDVPAFVKWLDR